MEDKSIEELEHKKGILELRLLRLNKEIAKRKAKLKLTHSLLRIIGILLTMLKIVVVLKPSLTEFGIHLRMDSCVTYYFQPLIFNSQLRLPSGAPL